MKRCWRIPLLLLLLSPVSGWAAGEWIEMYPADRLVREKPRLEGRANQMLGILRTLIMQGGMAGAQARLGLLASVRVEAPLSSDAGVPLDFSSKYSTGSGTIITPIFSLLFLEDLCTAYAWLHKKDYSLDTVDEYLAMLHYKSASDFKGGRYPPPLIALGIPVSAVDDPELGGLGLRFRNSAYAFIMAHELGHILNGHPSADKQTMEQSRTNEAAADDFALRVLARDAQVPTGAILFFQAQAYLMPSLGQFKAHGRSEQAWAAEMQSKISHPLTAERLKLMAAAVKREGRTQPPENRDTWDFVAVKLLSVADTLADVDLLQCMALAAARAPIAELAPQKTSSAERFLGRCVKRH
jgi:hypothetical protein